jgi:allophanate hydrolase subunit 2
MAAAIERAGAAARELEVPQSFSLGAGERLVLGGAPVGARTYLAVRGGWQTPLLLGSRSREQRLKAGAVLRAEPGQVPARRPVEALWNPPGASPLGIIAGPDAGLAVGLDEWATAAFRVGQHADRMGLRLEGPALTVKSPPQRISTPVAPGTVQIAGGQAIVLGIACGTMGGYPHVAHVISVDLDRVGQLRPGDSVRFRLVSLDEAWRLDRSARQARADRLRWLQAVAASG